MRYFVKLSYNGSSYAGFQIQPNVATIQGTLESTFSTITQKKINIVGCGRTDAGVHAIDYVAHVDIDTSLPRDFLKRLNKLLPADIVIHQLYQMHKQAHARFDAHSRSYQYNIIKYKDPFNQDTRAFDPYFHRLDIYTLNECASLILNYDEFFPFCKSKSDAEHYRCHLTKSQWSLSPERDLYTYETQANRFLRGMVRLIVGCCRQVCLGNISMQQVREAMESQNILSKAYSAPALGLFLVDVQYPEGYFQNPIFSKD